jgi:hypothetical protein
LLISLRSLLVIGSGREGVAAHRTSHVVLMKIAAAGWGHGQATGCGVEE